MRRKKTLIFTLIVAIVLTSFASVEKVATFAATTYEAELATLDSLTTESGSAYSGNKCVVMQSTGSCTFNITVSATGFYNLNFVSSGIGGDKYNQAFLDNKMIGEFQSKADVLSDARLNFVYIEKGQHQLVVKPSWGWIKLDCLEIEKSADRRNYYNVSGILSNPNASKEAKELMEFLVNCYGKYTLSGQQTDGGVKGEEFTAIKNATGKTPAIMGLDLMDYSWSRMENGATCDTVEKAIEFAKQGGIVTICWHWNAPSQYIKEGVDQNGNPNWWGGFYTDHVNMDFSAIMNGNDPQGYQALMNDISMIATQLKRLDDAGVPVLFRPLHEASGGWFWWGSGTAVDYRKLWCILYQKLTQEYQLNNLIWVYNGQSPEWYPGDEYVDIIGEDIYPGTQAYEPQSTRFINAANYTANMKLVTLSENGCLFDVDQAIKAGTLWSWFCVWGGEFACENNVISEKYTSLDMWKKVYNHAQVITLDELAAVREELRAGNQQATTGEDSKSDTGTNQNSAGTDSKSDTGTNQNSTGTDSKTGTNSETADTTQKTKLTKSAITLAASVSWTGKALKPAVTVSVDGQALKKGTDYTVSYKNNKNIGVATVTVKGIGNYSGTVQKTFQILPPKAVISSLKAKSGGFTAVIKKQSVATGYQLQYSTSKTMSAKKTKTITGVSTTISGLTKGKTYYVRVRSFATVSGKKYYGAWSAIKSIKTGK